MAWSLNALLDIPTREEKERQRSQGQAAVDRLSEMERADELARGHEEFSKRIGMDFDRKKYEEDLRRDVENMTNAGVDEKTAKKRVSQSRSAEGVLSAAKLIGGLFGINMGLPEKGAKVASKKLDAEGAKADEEKAASRNAREAEKGKAPYAFKGGEAGARALLAESNLKRVKAGYDMDALPDIAATAAAVREQTRMAAEDYKNAGAQRAMEHANNLMRLEQQQGFLKQTMGSPIWQAINAGVDPKAFGAGGLMGTGMLNLPAGESAGGVSQVGMPRKMSDEERLNKMFGIGGAVKTD